MKTAACLCSLIALALLAFGSWGRFTAAGRTRFDEMAGMVPLSAFHGGWVLLAPSVLLWLLVLSRT